MTIFEEKTYLHVTQNCCISLEMGEEHVYEIYLKSNNSF